MGFEALKKLREQQANSAGSGGVKWLGIKDGEKLRLRLLQELDDEAKNYSEKMGLARLTTEHVAPKEIYGAEHFRKRFLCTRDEGACWGCEQDDLGVKGWRGKGKLYVNVLIDNGKDDPFVAVWQQGTYDKNDVVNQLAEIVDDDGTWADREFKLSRKGTGLKTSYTLVPQGPSEYDVEQHADELFDLHSDAVVRHIPYEQQEKFVNAGGVPVVENDEADEDDGEETAW